MYFVKTNLNTLKLKVEHYSVIEGLGASQGRWGLLGAEIQLAQSETSIFEDRMDIIWQ